MQGKLFKNNPQSRRISPWAEYSEQRRAAARKYNALCNETRRAFREAQQEAYESWAAWDEAMK